MRRRRALAAALFALAAVSSCSDYPRYLLRAGVEEGRILWRRESIESLLAGPLDDDTRAKLELTLALREFAAERLSLDVGGSYRSLAEVDERQVVHVVSAAPRDSLEPYTWWFPIVGAVPYRGYFDRTAADALARDLEARGFDTYVRPSIAFSTLGWFDDPLLSNLLRLDAGRLADVVLHELLHNTIYLAGQASFNESFANFVGQRGAIAFFIERGDAATVETATARWLDSLDFSAFLGDELARLQEAYARGVDAAAREDLFAAMQHRFAARTWRTNRFSDFAETPINNAILAQRRVYAGDLALFERCFEQRGGDLAETIRFVLAATHRADDAYTALRAALAEQPGRSPASQR